MTEKTTIPKDWKEFIESLRSANVDFIIVGAWALSHHGRPRFTGDIDFFVRPNEQNAIRVLKALSSFGFGSLDITTNDISKPGQVIQLGVEPCRIDILTSISGVSFDEAWHKRSSGVLDGIPVSFLSADHLIHNKRVTGRDRDIRDALDLEQFLAQQKKSLLSGKNIE